MTALDSWFSEGIREMSITCEICKELMRADNYCRHMKTHVNAMLTPAVCTAAMSNKWPTVFYDVRKDDKGNRSVSTRFAMCLVCGATECPRPSEHGVARYDYARWCKECNKPHAGKFDGSTEVDGSTCQCPGPMPRLQNTIPNRVDDFIAYHNVECRGGFAAVQNVFLRRRMEPKVRGVRKGAQAPRKTLESQKAAREAVRFDDRAVRDMIAAKFPGEFDKYDYDSEEDREKG